MNADKNIGEWNTFDVTVQGNTVMLVHNGKIVIPKWTLPDLPAEGSIGLQHHGGPKGRTATTPASRRCCSTATSTSRNCRKKSGRVTFTFCVKGHPTSFSSVHAELVGVGFVVTGRELAPRCRRARGRTSRAPT